MYKTYSSKCVKIDAIIIMCKSHLSFLNVWVNVSRTPSSNVYAYQSYLLLYYTIVIYKFKKGI